MANSVSTQHVSFSLASIIAVVAAIWSFYAGAFFGLVLAGLAILFGLVGLALAFAPGVRGGIVSTLAILAGGVGVIAAIIKAVMYFLH